MHKDMQVSSERVQSRKIGVSASCDEDMLAQKQTEKA